MKAPQQAREWFMKALQVNGITDDEIKQCEEGIQKSIVLASEVENPLNL